MGWRVSAVQPRLSQAPHSSSRASCCTTASPWPTPSYAQAHTHTQAERASQAGFRLCVPHLLVDSCFLACCRVRARERREEEEVGAVTAYSCSRAHTSISTHSHSHTILVTSLSLLLFSFPRRSLIHEQNILFFCCGFCWCHRRCRLLSHSVLGRVSVSTRFCFRTPKTKQQQQNIHTKNNVSDTS